jgi:aminoglycoside 6'-N-acetyltransferase I
MRIVSLDPADTPSRRRCAELLVAGFGEMSPGHWNDVDDGLDEVAECLDLGPVRIAIDGDTVAGWVGLRPSYAKVWELHPLVVDPALQHRGIGRALVDDICAVAAAHGALTVTLGTDDEPGWTSLAGVDLYPDPVVHLARIEDRAGHPFVFYLKCGFSITGVTPDANGFGKPDIHMSKRVGRM